MILIWNPEVGERREWAFEPARLRSVEAELIEAQGGSTWDTFHEFSTLFMRGHLRAQRAALWLLRHRDDPALTFASVDVTPYEITVLWTDEEMARIRDGLRDNPDLDADQREYLLSQWGGKDDEAPDPKDSPSVSPPEMAQ
jgi:hypothetical protein